MYWFVLIHYFFYNENIDVFCKIIKALMYSLLNVKSMSTIIKIHKR